MRRIAGGALAWLLTLQFFVVETVVQLRAGLPYSRSADVVSALGDATWPGSALMNASFVVQAGLIGAGAVALLPALRGRAARPAVALLGTAALGVLLVGVFPRLTSPSLHTAGAALYLVGGGLGLIALAYAVRPWSEALGTTLALLGLFGTAMTVFYGAGVVGFLGEGGTERAAAYVLPVGLALAGPTLWRFTRTRTRPTPDADRPSRREQKARQREQERDARARAAAERDDALEAAGRRSAATPERPAAPAAPVTRTAADDRADDRADDDLDPEDPWADPRRRRGQ
ncbi:putative membrane protein [Geodermatophilus bullaregiensis]|uniref:DUF998 domain-containing protein n=1 Tax=Geodermatophilus bullaregiensis TaxID=1564160 RepID=UPI001EF8E593|nr:DUF998 domain-containing protein [Geodermatophilus bullaregiensis]MBM7804618.1 putative membrane protein [Geodermatophilus bullaregiensis]